MLDDGWLLKLLAPLAPADVQVVGGDAHVEPEDVVAKAFSLFWFFGPAGLRLNEKETLHCRARCYPNDVVFRA